MELNTAEPYITWLWNLTQLDSTVPDYGNLTQLDPTVPDLVLHFSISKMSRLSTWEDLTLNFFTKRSVSRRFFCLSHETVDGNKALIYNSQTNFPFQHLIYTFHQLSGRKRFKRQSGYSMTTCLTVGSKFSRKGQVKRTQWMRVLERMGLSLLLYFITHYPWINTSHLL